MNYRFLLLAVLVLTIPQISHAKTDVTDDNDEFSSYLENDDGVAAAAPLHVEANREAEKPSLQNDETTDQSSVTERPDGPASPEVIAEANSLEKSATRRVAVYEKPAVKNQIGHFTVVKVKSNFVAAKKTHLKKQAKHRQVAHHTKKKKHQPKLAIKKVHKKVQQG